MITRFSTSKTDRAARALAITFALLCASTTSFAYAASSEQPVSGGEITIVNGSDIKSWDPAITSSTFPGGPMDMLDAVYGFIVYVDVEGKVQGGMAESLTSQDAKVWTLKLRPGIKFTDGEAYDAEAVKFNWDRAADPATLAPAQTFVASWNKGVKIVDPLTIEITLPSPDRNFGSSLAQLAPFIGSPAALKAAEKKTDIKPVGAGAFLLESWNQGVVHDNEAQPQLLGSAAPLPEYIEVRRDPRNQQPDLNGRSGWSDHDGRLSVSVRLQRDGQGGHHPRNPAFWPLPRLFQPDEGYVHRPAGPSGVL